LSEPWDEIGSRIIKKSTFFDKFPFLTTFEGGFAVDADFGDGFSGSIEGPKTQKSHKFYRFY
jgi:hypothetical protein